MNNARCDKPADRPAARRCWALAVFATLFAYFALLMFQGFDMTDEGHHLTCQLMCVEGRGEYPFGMLWLTHVLGGLWLRLTAPLGLIGARLGWALCLSLTGLVAYLILSSYFSARTSAWALVAGGLATTHHGNMVINQNNLPFLILLSGTALLLAADRALDGPRGSVLAGLAGFVLGLAALARFPLLLALLLVFLPAAVRSWLAPQTASGRWCRACLACLGWVAAVGVGLSLLAAQKRLGTYLAQLSGTELGQGHAVSLMARLYAQDAVRMARLLIALLIKVVPWALGLHWICRALGRQRSAPLILAVALLIWIGRAVGVHGLTAVQWEYFLILPGLCLLVAVVEIWSAAKSLSSVSGKTEAVVLLVVAGVGPALLAAGTNNGLLNMTHGLWLFFPATAILLPASLADLRLRRQSGVEHWWSARSYTIAIVAILALIGVGIRAVNPYRDCRARWRLTAPIDFPRFRWVFTTPERARSVRDLFAELARHVRPGDVVLAYDGVPMVHFGTGTVPALDMPWPLLLNRAALARRLEHMATQGPAPQAVVRALTDTGDRRWGGGAVRSDPKRKEKGFDEMLAMIDAKVTQMGYTPVWSNADFVVLLPQHKLSAGAGYRDDWGRVDERKSVRSTPGGKAVRR